MLRHAVNLHAIQLQRSRRYGKDAGEAIHSGGFTRAIGADQPEDFSGTYLERQIADSADAAKRFAQRIYLKNRRCHVSPSLFLRLPKR
jgi:hypothetical protein